MTALNKYAELREELSNPANGSNHHLRKLALSLLDDLETKEAQRANWFQMAHKLGEDLDVAEKRIAELEARTVTLPPKEHDNGTDSQIDINAGFANRMWQKCYDAIRTAGIGVKGE